jgi:hypothetical protein
MSDPLELDENLDHTLDLDAPAATSPSALLGKPGALTGALVQRGREKAPRLVETSMPTEFGSPAAMQLAAVPALAAAPELRAALASSSSSRWTDVIFVAVCCVAFFATFLFVLNF